MKTSHSILSKHWVFATVGAALISATASTHAAYIPLAPLQPEGAPGAALGKLLTGTSGGVAGNTVIASSAIPFTATLGGTTTGILRSMVVDTTAGYDFYYQVVNTSSSPVHFGDDIFRLAIPGYDQGGFTVAATYLNDGVTTLGTLTGVPVAFTTTFLPNKGAFSGVFSADRDAALNTPDFYNGGAAFDFDTAKFFNTTGFPSPPSGLTNTPNNIDSGENSSWLVLRTNYSNFNVVQSAVLSAGGGTGLADTFAPIPEPSTIGFGLAMLGICGGGRFRKGRRSQES